ncbi:MAG: hypothetical protein KJ702_06750 [Gammaproteobacteria bacterium]|nr:hypothetical protein [Gammaproteobacteria bacterium]
MSNAETLHEPDDEFTDGYLHLIPTMQKLERRLKGADDYLQTGRFEHKPGRSETPVLSYHTAARGD